MPTNSDSTANESKTNGEHGGFKTTAATIAAIVAIVGFAVLLIFMVGLIGAEEKVWTRASFLLNGVEAIAFAAAGFLFGKEVHREQAEKAEKRADDSGKQASDAEKRAADAEAKGTALVGIIKAKAEGSRDKARTYALLGADKAAESVDVELNEMVRMAEHLFPPRV
jgi:hypothetical protein